MRLTPMIPLLALSCAPSPPAPRVGPAATDKVSELPEATWTGAAGEALGGCIVPAGDLDGDGYDDVLIGSEAQVGLHPGSGTGPATAPTRTWTASGGGCAAVGDVNGDGFDDLLITSAGDVVDLYAGSASGWPSARTTRLSGFVDTSAPRMRVIGDLDGDGDEELQDASGAVWLGGSGGLSATRPGPADGAFADIDGDGDIDRVSTARGSACTSGGASERTHDVVLYRGSSSGLDDEAVLVREGACTGTGGRIELDVVHGVFAAGDLDGDGSQDVLVALSLDVFDSSGVISEGALRGEPLAGRGAVPWFDGASFDLSAGPSRAGVHATPAGDTNCDDAGDVLIVGSDSFDACWLMDGADPDLIDASTLQQLGPVTPTGGACVGVGDLDADGADDVLWGDPLAAEGAGEVRFSPGAGVGCPVDLDLDGFDDDVDCNDTDDSIFPGATEGVDDGVDQDCDGRELCYVDIDEDGYRTSETVSSADLDCEDPGEAGQDTPDGDCDDLAPAVNPGAEESVADGIDQDCDGQELCWADHDGDGWRPEDAIVSSDADCDDPGEAGGQVPVGDCDDDDPTVNPAQVESPADGIDSNCDGEEVCFADADGDGVRTNQAVPSSDADCDDAGEALARADDGDCDDSDPSIFPGADEVEDDGIDQDCDGQDAEGSGCSSAAGPTGPGLLLLGGLLVGLRRRR